MYLCVVWLIPTKIGFFYKFLKLLKKPLLYARACCLLFSNITKNSDLSPTCGQATCCQKLRLSTSGNISHQRSDHNLPSVTCSLCWASDHY